MEPEIIEGKWYVVETNSGTDVIPHDVVGDIELYENDEPMFAAKVAPKLRDYCEGDPEAVELVEGFGARLSMPGYMDCTDWIVCVSLDEAKRELADAYDRCHECLGELDMDFRCDKCDPWLVKITWEPSATDEARAAVEVLVENSAVEVIRTERGLEFKPMRDIGVAAVVESIEREARRFEPIAVMCVDKQAP